MEKPGFKWDEGRMALSVEESVTSYSTKHYQTKLPDSAHLWCLSCMIYYSNAQLEVYKYEFSMGSITTIITIKLTELII
jgi:hypothetical protein